MAKTFTTAKERRSKADRNDPLGAAADAIAARRVLRDCHAALNELRLAAEGTEWRLRWVAVITLLRVVGHVLKKVDGERSPYLASAIDANWAKVTAPGGGNEIFHDFIERERNTILKEYDTSERLVAPVNAKSGPALGILVGTQIMKPLDALRDAITWWERLLVRVETEAQALRVRDRRR